MAWSESIRTGGVLQWPYPTRYGVTSEVTTDVLVLGGGIAGCWAAIGAARGGAKVTLVEKGATRSSGAGGSGCDHWMNAVGNPCSTVTAEEIASALSEGNNGYYNTMSCFIEARESFDRLQELEAMGGKIRDTEDEFKGAEFRDEQTKLLFAYDYTNKTVLRVWGSTFKSALHKQCKRLGVEVFDRTMATGLLTEGGKQGARVVGATLLNVRTGEFVVCRAKATVLCLARPARIWTFSSGTPGMSDFRPFQCCGDGHAIGWRAGVEFAMMEKSTPARWLGHRNPPPYGSGNPSNSWYACNMVDAEGKELPWRDRDGKPLTSISQRYHPADGQKFFLLLVSGLTRLSSAQHDHQMPHIEPVAKLLEQGFKLPFYADLTSMPDQERKAIFGLMLGEEGKTRIPVVKNYAEAGFDPTRDLLQSYGDIGWASGSTTAQERQHFGATGGVLNDWNLRASAEGLYAAGDQLWGKSGHAHAAATGHYAGRHAAEYAVGASESAVDQGQVEAEKRRVYAPVQREGGVGWKELNAGIVRVMQHYCSDLKTKELMELGLLSLEEIKEGEASDAFALNPHELMRTLEVLNILTNAQLVTHACLARRASSRWIGFQRLDYPDHEPPEWHKLITLKLENDQVKVGDRPLEYCGALEENYEAHNREYLDKDPRT
jgi:succinate dehydrogenase/fumarate reductase flavoprotein subunit